MLRNQGVVRVKDKQLPEITPGRHTGRWLTGAAIAAGTAAAVGAGFKLAHERREQHIQQQIAAARDVLGRYPDQAALLMRPRPDEAETADLVRHIAAASFRHEYGVALPEVTHLCGKYGAYPRKLIEEAVNLLGSTAQHGQGVVRVYLGDGEQTFVEPTAHLVELLEIAPDTLGGLPDMVAAFREG
jgi:hypothetical protein